MPRIQQAAQQQGHDGRGRVSAQDGERARLPDGLGIAFIAVQQGRTGTGGRRQESEVDAHDHHDERRSSHTGGLAEAVDDRLPSSLLRERPSGRPAPVEARIRVVALGNA